MLLLPSECSLSVRDQRKSQGRKREGAQGSGGVLERPLVATHVLKAEAHVHVCKRSDFSQAKAPGSFEILAVLKERE